MDIEEVVVKISEDLNDMKESQIRMEADLKYHIRRTDILENKVDKELKPIHRAFIGIKWSVGAILTLAALVGALSKIGVISLP